jgi:hypothetical protein
MADFIGLPFDFSHKLSTNRMIELHRHGLTPNLRARETQCFEETRELLLGKLPLIAAVEIGREETQRTCRPACVATVQPR